MEDGSAGLLVARVAGVDAVTANFSGGKLYLCGHEPYVREALSRRALNFFLLTKLSRK